LHNLTKEEYLYKNGGRFEIKFITERIQSRVTNPRQPLWLSKTRTSRGKTEKVTKEEAQKAIENVKQKNGR
jgi:hypothetical protein